MQILKFDIDNFAKLLKFISFLNFKNSNKIYKQFFYLLFSMFFLFFDFFKFYSFLSARVNTSYESLYSSLYYNQIKHLLFDFDLYHQYSQIFTNFIYHLQNLKYLILFVVFFHSFINFQWAGSYSARFNCVFYQNYLRIAYFSNPQLFYKNKQLAFKKFYF